VAEPPRRFEADPKTSAACLSKAFAPKVVDLDRDVHCSELSKEEIKASALQWSPADTELRCMVIPAFFFAAGAATICALLVVTGLRLLGVKGGITSLAVFMGCAGVLMPLFLLRVRGRKPPRDHPARAATLPDRRFRLRLVGRTRDMIAIGPLTDDPFEPAVHYIPGVVRGAMWPIAVLYVVLTVAATLVILAVQNGNPVLRPFAGAAPGAVTPFHFWAGMAVAILPFMYLWPAYLRVVPGRLDIIEYGFLGSGKPRVRRIDLRDADVLVVSEMRTFRVGAPGREPMTVQCGVTLRWHELVRAVFNAARSGHPAPAMPDDELVG